MDEELERARRDVRENMEDAAVAIRLASACERAGRFAEAWSTLVRLVGRSEDQPALLRSIAELSARHPRAMVHYLRHVEVGRARFSCRALVKARELLPLVVVSLDEPLEVRQRRAQIVLREALDGTIDGLPGVQPLASFVQSDNPRDWVQTIMSTAQALQGGPPEETRETVFRELGLVARAISPLVEPHPFGPDPFGPDPFGGNPFEGVADPFGSAPSRPPPPPLPGPVGPDPFGGDPFGGDPFGGEPANPAPFGAGELVANMLARLPSRDHRGWLVFARDLVVRAREERRVVLAPWVHVATSSTDETLASLARSVFAELTGQAAPPLDPDVLAARWPR